MNLAQLRDWIRRRLGAPVVRVELTDSQIDDAFGTAVDKYLYYRRPQEAYYYFNTAAGQNEYGPADFTTYRESVIKFSDLPLTGNTDGDIRLVYNEDKNYKWNPNISSWEIYNPTTIPLDVLTSTREVVYQPVESIINQLVQSQSDFFLAYYYRRSGGMFIADLWIAMSAKESFDMVLGLQPTWEIVDNKLYLFPTPQGSIRVGIRYAVMPSEEQLASQEWVTKATLALSKQTLGRVRSKYGSIPGPAGEGITLDGPALLEEGRAEWEWLLNDAMVRGDPLSFGIG